MGGSQIRDSGLQHGKPGFRHILTLFALKRVLCICAWAKSENTAVADIESTRSWDAGLKGDIWWILAAWKSL